MKKTVKFLSLLLALLMIALVMFACNDDGASDDEKEKEEEKYLDLSPEQVYNKVSKAKNVTVTYKSISENYESEMVFTKDSDVVKIDSIHTYDGEEYSETHFINLDTSDMYEEEDGKWYYEKDESSKRMVERYISLVMLEEEYSNIFSKENAFEKDNYDYSDNVYTFKSDVLATLNEDSDLQVESLVMKRDGKVYTFTIAAHEDYDEDDSATLEITVDFSETDVALPEGAIEIKYETHTVTVKDANGNPIDDIEVNIYSGDENYEDWEYTNDDGKAEFELQVGKNYYITLYYWGDVEYEIREKYYFDGTSAEIILAEKEKVIYKVTVSGADGVYLEDIDVTLYDVNTDHSVDWEYTDENGFVSFIFDESGNYYVRLYGIPNEYKVEEKYYFDGNTTLNIVLEEKDSYKITIKDADGNPVEYMTVNLYNASGDYVAADTTDSEGSAKIIVDEEYNYVYVTLSSYEGERKYVINSSYSFDSGSKELEIVLELKASITVRVLNSVGDSIYNVRVVLRDEDSYSWSGEDYYYTDSDGYVVFYDFDENKDYYITIDNVPYVYDYEESYELDGDTLTIYLTPKA